MAAIAVAGLVLVGLVRLLAVLGESRDDIARRAAQSDSAGNGAWLARALLERAAARTDSAERFVGDEGRVSFTTYCETPSGWLALCRAELSLAGADDSTIALVTIDSGTSMRAWALPGAASFRYFDPASRDHTWVHQWGASITPPAAIGVVTRDDTIIFPTGGRP